MTDTDSEYTSNLSGYISEGKYNVGYAEVKTPSVEEVLPVSTSVDTATTNEVTLKMANLEPKADTTLLSVSYDSEAVKAEGKLDITLNLYNSGGKDIKSLVVKIGDSSNNVSASIPVGETKTVKVEYTVPSLSQATEYDISVLANGDEISDEDNQGSIVLGQSDLKVEANHSYLLGSDMADLTISNLSNFPTELTLTIYKGTVAEENVLQQIDLPELDNESVQALSFDLTALEEKHGRIDTFYFEVMPSAEVSQISATQSSEFSTVDNVDLVNLSVGRAAILPDYTSTVTFNPKGGTINGSTSLVTDSSGNLSTIPTATRENYTFLGWSTSSGGSVNVTKYYVFKEDTTVYAQWKEDVVEEESKPSGSSSGSSSYTSSTTKTYASHSQTGVVEVEGGTFIVSPEKAKAGAEITIEVSPYEGYVLASILVVNENGEEIDVLATDDPHIFTFIQGNSANEVTVVFSLEVTVSPFTDVTADQWFYDAVHFVQERGLMEGIGEGLFAPDMATNRGMIVTIFHQLAGKPSVSTSNAFHDVSTKDYFFQATQWAMETGISSGMGDGVFGADHDMTREQLVTMLYAYGRIVEGMKVDPDAELPFTDVSDINGWAKDATAWCVDHGFIEGRPDGSFDPSATASRGEVAAILKTFVEYFDDKT